MTIPSSPTDAAMFPAPVASSMYTVPATWVTFNSTLLKSCSCPKANVADIATTSSTCTRMVSSRPGPQMSGRYCNARGFANQALKDMPVLLRVGAVVERRQLVGSGLVDDPAGAAVAGFLKQQFAASVSVGVYGIHQLQARELIQVLRIGDRREHRLQFAVNVLMSNHGEERIRGGVRGGGIGS